MQGGLLDAGIRAGKDIKTIMQEYNTALGFYSMLLPESMVKARVDVANQKYAEFFNAHVLPNLPDAKVSLEGLLKLGTGGGLTERQALGLGSIMPVVNDTLLAPGGGVFGELRIDLAALKSAAAKDFYWKEGDGITRLFDASVEAMAEQYFGSGPEKAKERQQFKADVLGALEPLLEKVASGQVGLRDLAGNIERIVQGMKGVGGDLWGYRHAVATALQGLVHGANLVSRMPAHPDFDPAKSGLVKNLETYSINDLIAMITIATGMAGKGIAATGGESRFFLGSSGNASIARKMFGTEGSAWSKTVLNLNLDYMDKSFLQDSIQEMSKLVTEQVKKDLPGTEVIGPIVVTADVEADAIKTMIDPSLNALAEAFFAKNPEAQAQYKMNFTTVFTALWSLARPGGNIETLKSQINELINKTVTAAPAGVDQVKYKEALLSGVTSLLNASRAIYAGVNMTNPSWDSIGVIILHSMASLAAMQKTIGVTIAGSSSFVGSLIGVADEFVAAERKIVASFFKNSGTLISGIAGIGWLPVEYYQLIKALKDGKSDPVDLAFMGIGTVADTIGAVEGVYGIANMLVNSTFLGRTGAQVLLPVAFSTAFTAAAVVSWVAWAGLAIYQGVKQELAFHKQTDDINDALKRLVNDTVSTYVIPGPNPRMPVPQRTPEQVELTPENWDTIRQAIEARRGSVPAS